MGGFLPAPAVASIIARRGVLSTPVYIKKTT